MSKMNSPYHNHTKAVHLNKFDSHIVYQSQIIKQIPEINSTRQNLPENQVLKFDFMWIFPKVSYIEYSGYNGGHLHFVHQITSNHKTTELSNDFPMAKSTKKDIPWAILYQFSKTYILFIWGVILGVILNSYLKSHQMIKLAPERNYP